MSPPDTLGRARRELTDVILHRFLEEVIHVLSVQAVQGHADLVMQPLQPELCKTPGSPALPPPKPKGGLKAGTAP